MARRRPSLPTTNCHTDSNRPATRCSEACVVLLSSSFEGAFPACGSDTRSPPLVAWPQPPATARARVEVCVSTVCARVARLGVVERAGVGPPAGCANSPAAEIARVSPGRTARRPAGGRGRGVRRGSAGGRNRQHGSRPDDQPQHHGSAAWRASVVRPSPPRRRQTRRQIRRRYAACRRGGRLRGPMPPVRLSAERGTCPGFGLARTGCGGFQAGGLRVCWRWSGSC